MSTPRVKSQMGHSLVFANLEPLEMEIIVGVSTICLHIYQEDICHPLVYGSCWNHALDTEIFCKHVMGTKAFCQIFMGFEMFLG